MGDCVLLLAPEILNVDQQTLLTSTFTAACTLLTNIMYTYIANVIGFTAQNNAYSYN